MSEIIQKLFDAANETTTVSVRLHDLLIKAASRISELEATQGDPQNFVRREDFETLLRAEREKTERARKAEDEANQIIKTIAEAAECDNFADIIIARVSALAQQANAMTRICEGHIATCRKETAKAADYLAANKKLSERFDALNNQDNQKRAMLHRIADELGAGSRNALPALDWYLKTIENLNHEANNRSAASSANHREYLNAIGEAVGKTGLSYKDLVDYFRGLDLAALQAKAADAEKVKAEAERRVRELTESLAIIHEAVGKPGLSHTDLANYFRGLDIAALQAKAADAEKVKAEAERRVRELETALAACQDASKEARWDKFRTEALRQLLTQNGYWPQYDDMSGLKKLTAYVANLKTRVASFDAELASRDCTIAELNEKVTNLEAAAQRGCQAENELSLSVGAIKRMHAKLLENKPWTGIWPDGVVFRAKLDDIEWCLNVYVGRYLEAMSQHEADTKFIASVRDSLSHEILRRNKQ